MTAIAQIAVRRAVAKIEVLGELAPHEIALYEQLNTEFVAHVRKARGDVPTDGVARCDPTASENLCETAPF